MKKATMRKKFVILIKKLDDIGYAGEICAVYCDFGKNNDVWFRCIRCGF